MASVVIGVFGAGFLSQSLLHQRTGSENYRFDGDVFCQLDSSQSLLHQRTGSEFAIRYFGNAAAQILSQSLLHQRTGSEFPVPRRVQQAAFWGLNRFFTSEQGQSSGGILYGSTPRPGVVSIASSPANRVRERLSPSFWQASAYGRLNRFFTSEQGQRHRFFERHGQAAAGSLNRFFTSEQGQSYFVWMFQKTYFRSQSLLHQRTGSERSCGRQGRVRIPHVSIASSPANRVRELPRYLTDPSIHIPPFSVKSFSLPSSRL